MSGSAPRYLGRGTHWLIMNYDSRLPADPAEEEAQIAGIKGDAAGRRRQSRAGNMDKHGAAAASHARPGVVIDFDEDVVESIIAPKPVAWFIGRPPERAVIAAVGRIFGPGVGTTDTARRQRRRRARQPISAPP